MNPYIKIRCICTNQELSDVAKIALSKKWSLDEVEEKNGCGSVCGLCKPYLEKEIDSLNRK